MQCHLRAQRSWTFTRGFLPCHTHTEIPLDSLNRFTIVCMVLGDRSKFFAFLTVSHEIWVQRKNCHKVMSHDPTLLAKTDLLLLYPNMIPSPQGRTYPLGKGRRLPWAPRSQGPPKMLFIYDMRIKCGQENVYYHDNRLRVRVEHASCVSCLYQIKILYIWSWRPHKPEISLS